MNRTRTAGILGGMGGLATITFYKELLQAQQVKTEQEYLDAIIYSKTSIPDRTRFILDATQPDPTPALVDGAVKLAQAGVDFIAIPCVTAHYFYPQIAQAVEIPVVNLLEEIAQHVQGYKSVGLLATTGTLESRILHQVLDGVQVVTPVNQGAIMDYIYAIKKGEHPPQPRLEWDIPTLLGCSELSTAHWPGEVIDPMELLAQACLRFANCEFTGG